MTHTFLDVGVIINCRQVNSSKKYATSCALRVIRDKVEKAVGLLLQKIENVKEIVQKYYGSHRTKARLGDPKTIAKKIAQLLYSHGYADVAFLFQVIAQYPIRDVEDLIERSLLRTRRRIDPMNFLTAIYLHVRKNRHTFADKVRGDVEKSLDQLGIEVVYVDDSDIWRKLGPGPDREDKYQILCIEKYRRDNALNNVTLLTTDHALAQTAKLYNVEAHLVSCAASA
jgi:hypothetical protein